MFDYYIVFDADGNLISRLLPGVEPIDGAVKVSEDVWRKTLVETDGAWKLDSDGEITKQPLPAPPPPTAEQILAVNQTTRSSLHAQASETMTPLLVSLQLGNATDAEIASAKVWQAYVRALNVVDLTVADPPWPTIPA